MRPLSLIPSFSLDQQNKSRALQFFSLFFSHTEAGQESPFALALGSQPIWEDVIKISGCYFVPSRISIPRLSFFIYPTLLCLYSMLSCSAFILLKEERRTEEKHVIKTKSRSNKNSTNNHQEPLVITVCSIDAVGSRAVQTTETETIVNLLE